MRPALDKLLDALESGYGVYVIFFLNTLGMLWHKQKSPPKRTMSLILLSVPLNGPPSIVNCRSRSVSIEARSAAVRDR